MCAPIRLPTRVTSCHFDEGKPDTADWSARSGLPSLEPVTWTDPTLVPSVTPVASCARTVHADEWLTWNLYVELRNVASSARGATNFGEQFTVHGAWPPPANCEAAKAPTITATTMRIRTSPPAIIAGASLYWRAVG